MLASTSLVFAALVTVANAHFQLKFPEPRGVFVEDDEPKFCDGYDDVAKQRVPFPLTGGFVNLNSEHESWSVGVALATKVPTLFNDFVPVIPFFKATGEGLKCINLDFSQTNATGLTDGQNVTIQITFAGGDGNLFQCADLTLSNSAKIDSSVTCKDLVGGSSASPSSASSTGSGTAPPPTGSSPPGGGGALATAASPAYLGLVLAFAGLAGVFL